MRRINERRRTFRKAKAAGFEAHEVYKMILDETKKHTGPHAPAENAMNLADALMEIEIVYGKRARRKCEEMR